MCAYGREPHWGPCEEVTRQEAERHAREVVDDIHRAHERKVRYYGTRDEATLRKLPDRSTN